MLADPDGRPIVETAKLTGSKWAVRRGGKLYVSPAMMTLLRDCESEDEFRKLVAKIPHRVYSARDPFPDPSK